MVVFIDGENFRQNLAQILFEAGEITDKNEFFRFNIPGLLTELLGHDNLTIRYYASEIKMPKGYIPSDNILKQVQRIKERMRKWVAMLRTQDINYIKAGNLKVKEGKNCWRCGTANEILQEKGVDVRMALDIYEESLLDNCTKIAVISSDTDICPAYHKAKKQGVELKYICFANHVNLGAAAACDETITITQQMATKYLI